MLELMTFVISHFSEKARWSLDFEGLSYAERRLIPGLHIASVRRIAPTTTVPILLHEGRAIQGSSAILDYLDTALGAKRLAVRPEDRERARELEALADHAFGLGVQRIFYATLLADRKTVTDLWTQDGPRYGRAFYALAYPVVALLVGRKYDLRPDALERAKDRFRRAVDTMDRALAQHPFLLGDTLTRVDVSVASLFAPVCRPPEHPVRWPEPKEPLASFVAEFKGRPLYDHVLRLYREHRVPRTAE